MTNFIIAAIFLVFALLGIVLKKTYFSLPIRELKRRAQKQDKAAMQIYRAAAYGNSLQSLLWLFIGLTSAVSLILFAKQLPVWLGILIVGPLLWIVFSLLPSSRVSKFGMLLTRIVTPVVAWLLNLLHPLLNRSADFVEKRLVPPRHTGIYESEDLLRLIDHQRTLEDSRLSDEELDIVHRTLSFGSFKVSDILIPSSKVKTVLAGDVVGPVLIDELHKNSQDYVLVRETKKGEFVGTLAFAKLNLKSSGHVRDIMESTVYYLHENDSLSEALHAFFVTNHPLFVVVNKFEEYMGIVSIENVLRNLTRR